MVRQPPLARLLRRLALASLASLVPLAAASGQDSLAARSERDSLRMAWASITYVAGTSVYIDAGSSHGLREGERLEVIRGGTRIAEVTVAILSSTRASGKVAPGGAIPLVGDSVRYAIRAVAAPTKSAAATPRAPPRDVGTLSGRFGLRYFDTRSTDAGLGRLTQPAMDARIDGRHLGGSPVGITVDVRAHRTSSRDRSGTASAVSSTASTRVYQAAVHFEPRGAPGRLTIGRQFSSAIPAIGLFDGVAGDWYGRRTAAGLFAGAQPDPVTFGMSGDVQEYGAWAQLHNAPRDPAVWSMTTGLIGSYAGGDINREFVYAQGLLVMPALSLFAAQELDINRGWRADVESSGATPTSTYATARLALGNAMSLHAGYDNRRSVRLYRDFLHPEVEFDDSFRQGTWGGTQIVFGRHLQAGLDVRTSRGGAAGSATSRTVSLGLVRITPLALAVRARATGYAGDLLAGRLASASLELQPLGAVQVELSAGQRQDIRAPGEPEGSRLTWTGADLDLELGRSVYLTLSTYRERGIGGAIQQTYAALTYRF